jgi:isopentenyl diphosphate isomerase/L-lactate dehydrogenase-like FMN-dependent dehydrogenase
MRERTSRRAFLKFLASSPLLSPLSALACLGERPAPATDTARLGTPGTPGEPDQDLGELISSPDQALDVFDFRVSAQRALPPAHYGYIATGVDGDATLRANREAFARLALRPRRLVGVESLDTRTSLLGSTWETPIVIAPAGSQRAFHPEGELATARAAKAGRHLQILSTVSSTGVEQVVEARGEPVWYQLYPTSRWDVTQKLLARAEAAGCPVVVLTVDLPVSSNRLTLSRYIKRDSRDCRQCHGGGDPYAEQNTTLRRKPMFAGTDVTDDQFDTPALTWDFVDRLRDATRMRVVLKGIVTAEDAAQCLAHGVDAIIVSNHGGRAEESGRATLDSLPEVVRAVRRRVPVLVDGGIRRGTDAFKALALGADAVCIGRPYLWGLGAFGQPGVEKVLSLLRAELETAMRLAGTRTLRDIGPSAVVPA